jgi:hypothetical protein
MISHRHRCIFVHIPKTGGTGIEDVVWPGARTEAELWMGLIEPLRNRYQSGGLQHLLAHHIRMEVGAETFAAYFKFSIVRNPWDKVVSQYAAMRQRADLRSYIGLADDASLADYLALIARFEHVQWMPQVAFVQDTSGNSMLDFIGRFETLEADTQRVFARIGIDCPRLPRVNASQRWRDYRWYFNAGTRCAVARIYAADIEQFGYVF